MTTPPKLAEMWTPMGYATIGVNVCSSSQVEFQPPVYASPPVGVGLLGCGREHA
ncbi:hypothetical protein [Micromonospora coerulea]|uniref:hypothetical protein n=1 Tax=Micromonospora coerulea TaxID=47856 RepID=UPI0031F7A3E3